MEYKETNDVNKTVLKLLGVLDDDLARMVVDDGKNAWGFLEVQIIRELKKLVEILGNFNK